MPWSTLWWNSAVAFVACVLAACGGDSVDGEPSPGPLLTWGAHTGAGFEPCGCVAGMHGGLVRRATLLEHIPAHHRVLVELGGWSAGPADHHRLRTRHYLAALADLDTEAVAIGRQEVALGLDFLAMSAGVGPPLLAVNLEAEGPQRPWQASRRVERHGRAWRLTAVVPADATGPGLMVSDPIAAVAALQRRHAEESLVVLADLDEAGLAHLARQLPGVHAVIGGDVSGPSHGRLRLGGVEIAHVANHGKSIGWWPLAGGAPFFDLITDDIPDHIGVRAHVVAYQHDLAGRELDIDRGQGGLTNLRAGPAHGWVGSTTCRSCHEEAHELWRPSPHAKAYATLEHLGYAYDPDCLRCHVTDLGGAFRRLDPDPILTAVGCETCHGPGREHVVSGAATDSLRTLTPASCVVCHDAENSPHFDHDSYWERIRHE